MTKIKVIRKDGAPSLVLALEAADLPLLAAGIFIDLEKEAGCRPAALVVVLGEQLGEFMKAAIEKGGSIVPLGQQ